MSPLEILKGRKIDLDHIRVFGCTCFVHIKRNDKLDKNSVKTIFLGYSSEKRDINAMIQRILRFIFHEMWYFSKTHPIIKQIPQTNQLCYNPIISYFLKKLVKNR
jgi:hypothetical protein